MSCEKRRQQNQPWASQMKWQRPHLRKRLEHQRRRDACQDASETDEMHGLKIACVTASQRPVSASPTQTNLERPRSRRGASG